jgi:hypothetical protein
MSVNDLNATTCEARLAALKTCPQSAQAERSEEVNNHVHTIYSFSPYSPTMAAYLARQAGLQAVGIMDHDSVSGSLEMLEACKTIGIASTCGCELRVNFDGTRLAGRKFNNPDSANIVYMAIHGIPKGRLQEVERFLEPIHAARNLRNQAMVAKLNELTAPLGLEPIDFERDVKGISQAAKGGSITERHLLFALVHKLVARAGRGAALVEFLENDLHVVLAGKIREFLLDAANPHYLYDLLGVLKSSFLGQIFIQPNHEECISVFQAVDFANRINAIPAYAYLGDVTDSPTGDKKAEKFEDDFLDELVPELKTIGFKAITYMPPRNTKTQLLRIQQLCAKYELMEISGVDINSSRQQFNCPIILEPEFAHLIDATWALIAHEKLASCDETQALFNRANPLADQSLAERIKHYSAIGRKIDPHHPELVQDIR